MTPSQALPAVLQQIDAGLDQSLERLFEFLRIQSISTDPAYSKECQTAAAYVAKDLSGIGFQTSIRQTEGHPIVVGKGGGEGDGKRPRVLFYGHYDVQPVDPLDLWDTPPFTPRIPRRPQDHRRARSLRRQRSGDDLRRGVPRLRGGHRPIAAPHHHDD